MEAFMGEEFGDTVVDAIENGGPQLRRESREEDRSPIGTGDLQFYTTPDWLADVVWEMFDNKDYERVCDACAGTGALADAWKRKWDASASYMRRNTIPVDCIELDARHHPTLREKGYSVVGMNFLEFEGGSVFSHVVLNPPFQSGVKHVLKAWDMLWAGEVCAIINAETIRNPNSHERQRLQRLLADHGKVRYFQDAFKGDGVLREANVEVAVVHLKKDAESASDWIGPIIASMKSDQEPDEEYKLPTALALPNSFVTNQCVAFRMAVKAMREAVRAEAVASHFSSRVGRTMAEHNAKGDTKADPFAGEVAKTISDGFRSQFRDRYTDLKDRAWTSVLRSTETLSRMSRKVQKMAESQFEQIKTLEFTEGNVYSFLLGLVESQPEMQIDMILDVFDQVSRYHSDNLVFFKGWKSNDKHRTCGMRLRTTRFILPGHRSESYSREMPWDTRQMLSDFDKVFGILDGKAKADVSLVDAVNNHFTELRHGQRVSASYFDLRYYPQAGTLHFFCRRKDLMDRLNRLVGAKRQWLPPADAQGTDTFWKQFDNAEKFDGEVRDAAKAVSREKRGIGHSSRWDDPIVAAMNDARDGHQSGLDTLATAIDRVLEKHGLLDALTMEQKRAEGSLQGGGPLLQLTLLG